MPVTWCRRAEQVSRTDPTRSRPPRWVVWALTIPGVVALSIGVVDFQYSIRDNGAFRLRAGLAGVVLMLLARLVGRRAARTRSARARVPR